MPILPNLGGGARIVYALAGMGLAAWGLFGAETGWGRMASALGGGALIVEGLIGF